MSVIQSAAADGFIAREAGRHPFYLVHGSDEGLTHERVLAIVRKVLGDEDNPLNLLRLDGDQIARDPGALADEAYAVSMFGGPRVVWIDAQRLDLVPALSPLLANPPPGCAIVVRAQQIRKEGPLRQAFERTPSAIVIECYSDDQASLSRLIDGEAQAAGIAVSPEARSALTALLGADRETTRGEIAKLFLYAIGRERIETEDLEAIVSGAAPSKLERVVDRSLSGEVRETAVSAAQFFNDGGDGEQLIGRLIAHFVLIHRTRLEMDRSSSPDVGRSPFSARLPPNARRALSRQADAWTLDAIARRLPLIQAASANIRARPRLARLLAARMLWSLASGAARGRPTSN